MTAPAEGRRNGSQKGNLASREENIADVMFPADFSHDLRDKEFFFS